MSIFSDPVNWSRKIAGSKSRLVGTVLTNLVIIALLLFAFRTPADQYFLIAFLYILIPGAYLYCLFNCIKHIDGKKPLAIPDKYSFLIGFISGAGGLVLIFLLSGIKFYSIKSIFGLIAAAVIIGSFLGMRCLSDPKE